jgi:MarR family transcriptional regulator, transcriptional regulator for hemolysin
MTLASTAKAVSRAFDEALGAAGGSTAIWLILIALKRRRWDTQAELARAVGIQGPTLTHHLGSLEAAGLITRYRPRENRRIQVVELTDDGHAMFHRLRKAAWGFDKRLRASLTDVEVDQLRTLLNQLRGNVTEEATA